MQLETIRIDQLSNDPANVRRHSERNIAVVVASLRRFGQQHPLIVDQSNVVRIGNCRLEAMRRLGWSECVVIRTNLSGAELAAFAIADNRSGDPEIGSTFDQASLADVLSALRSEDESLVTDAGFDLNDLAALLGGSNEAPAPDSPPDEFKAFDESIETNCQCPQCGFRWMDAKQ